MSRLCISTLAARSRPCERSRGPGWDKWRFPTTISGWTGQLHRQRYLWQGPEVSMNSRQTSWIDVLMVRMSSTMCSLPKCSATLHLGSLARAAMRRLDLSCAALPDFLPDNTPAYRIFLSPCMALTPHRQFPINRACRVEGTSLSRSLGAGAHTQAIFNNCQATTAKKHSLTIEAGLGTATNKPIAPGS
jgi:hypothetical protein